METVTIRLSYFKLSGKYYCGGELHVGEGSHMYDLADSIRERNVRGELPGLTSGRWEGFVHVDASAHPMGFPMLIQLPAV